MAVSARAVGSPSSKRHLPRASPPPFSLNPSTMANNIPVSLRTADIGRFALRAAQIEKAKPVVAYWCELSVYAPRHGIPELTASLMH
jgi:hypothetical protein